MSNDKQQTAVEWLYNELLNAEPNILEWNKLFEQAKEMQRQQAIKLYYQYDLYVLMNESYVMTFGQFYKQTYGGGKQ